MAEAAQKIERRKLSDEVRERLLALIREQPLKPGDVIPSERELMEKYGVGRPAVREAMQSLQSAGLIDIRHGERPRVAEPSMPNMLDQIGEAIRHMLLNSDATLENLKQARIFFELQLVQIAAERATSDDVAELVAIVEEQSSLRDDRPRFRACDGRFHAKIADISGNPIFPALLSAVFNWLSDFHSEMVSAPSLEDLTIQEHLKVIEAIRDKDADRAAKEMSDHLTRANSLYKTSPNS